ncbi:MAG: sulfotransferase [Desulfobacteraceae bacterium]|nr:sulfotransferase [Desulfobacteraceae bacterium]
MTIFMIGTQRSGSNLLRLMLNQQPAIASPHPSHILERFMPLLPGYGDLSLDANFDQLVDDICRMIEANPVAWTGVTLDREVVKLCCLERSLMAIYGAVHDLMSEAKGALVWCCKSLANVYFLPQIGNYFPDARYIHIYRDGRDVAVSFRKAVVGEKSYYHIAKYWHAEQQLALGLKAKVDAANFFSVSYEDLTADSERVLKEMMYHFKIPFVEEMLHFNISEEAMETAKCGALWANVQQPVIKNNTRKFLKEASKKDMRIFELVAGESLDNLGYDRMYTRKGEGMTFDSADIRLFEEENKRLKKEIVNTIDSGDLSLRSLQQKLLKEISSRTK